MPSNILEETDWDLKTFPCLHPDGKDSLHTKRAIRLTDQDYFVQRLMNKDRRFCQSPAYVFAVASFIEKKQIQRNTGVAFIRGKSKKNKSGGLTYTMDDPYSVLDEIKNTPRYWQKNRYGELV